MSALVNRFVLRFAPRVSEHLEASTLAELFCGELARVDAWIARRHLADCKDCLKRKEHLEGAGGEAVFRFYQESLGTLDAKLSQKPRAEFSAWLELQGRPLSNQARVSWFSIIPPLRYSLASACAGVAFGLAISVVFFWWQRVPNVSANAFLVHAEKWDGVMASASSDVAEQTVQIKTARQQVERSVYWDLRGKRIPRHSSLSGTNQRLKATLEGAGVDWERPMSASAYQAWHDRQHVRADRISRSGSHLLTLTTTIPDGQVSGESLTVRDSDFHPVKRTVQFRESGTIEIAEVEFKLLPWSAVDANAFEATGDLSRTAVVVPNQPVLPHLPDRLSPMVMSDDQLDEVELSARLVLNQLHADTGEQIELHRFSQEVEVTGLVQTEERKRELKTRLMAVPGLKVSIESVDDVASKPAPAATTVSIKAAELPDNASALETYLRARGHTTDTINAVARRFFIGAMTISQETRAIADLQSRFRIKKSMPVIASATLSELLYSHHQRLVAALREERLTLVQMEGNSRPDLSAVEVTDAQSPTGEARASLGDAARNLALVRELTQTGSPAERKAQVIFAAMSQTVEHLSIDSRDVFAKVEEDPKLSTNAGEKR